MSLSRAPFRAPAPCPADTSQSQPRTADPDRTRPATGGLPVPVRRATGAVSSLSLDLSLGTASSSWPGAFPFGSGKVWCGCAGPVQPDVRVLACMCCVADGRPGREPLRGGGWCAVADRRRMAIMSGREKMDSLACHRQILPTTVNRPGRPVKRAQDWAVDAWYSMTDEYVTCLAVRRFFFGLYHTQLVFMRCLPCIYMSTEGPES